MGSFRLSEQAVLLLMRWRSSLPIAIGHVVILLLGLICLGSPVGHMILEISFSPSTSI